MTEIERQGLSALGWLQRHLAVLLSAVFAAGVAYSQLSHLDTRLAFTAGEIKEIRREILAIRVSATGVAPSAFEAFVERHDRLERRRAAELERLREADAALRGEIARLKAGRPARAPAP